MAISTATSYPSAIFNGCNPKIKLLYYPYLINVQLVIVMLLQIQRLQLYHRRFNYLDFLITQQGV
jgi:hypothetical protein